MFEHYQTLSHCTYGELCGFGGGAEGLIVAQKVVDAGVELGDVARREYVDAVVFRYEYHFVVAGQYAHYLLASQYAAFVGALHSSAAHYRQAAVLKAEVKTVAGYGRGVDFVVSLEHMRHAVGCHSYHVVVALEEKAFAQTVYVPYFAQ